MENEEKETKKGLFRITKVKVAVAAVATAALMAVGALFGTDNPVKDYLLGNTNTELDGNVDDKKEENGQPDGDGVQQTPAPSPDVTPEPTATPDPVEKEPELTPEDEGYYFDEEDPEESLSDEATNTNDVNNGQTNQTTTAVDDFADLVIPNINAYKGMGNSIIDALKYCGYPSDRAYRARLAAFFGIEDYQYLGYQNLQLMEYLYQYYAYLDDNTDTNTNQNTNSNTNTNNNSSSNNSSSDNSNNGNDNTNGDNKDNSDNKGEQHTCSFGEWVSLNDEKEIRKCSCGKYEDRDHSYGPWIDLGNGKEVRFCKTCGHVHERDKHQEQECDHTLGAWKDNGDGTCSRECACGQEKETKAHVQGQLVSSRKYVNDNNEYIEESTYKCANCGTEYTTSVKLGDVIVKEIPGDDTNHKLVCIIDGVEVEIGTEAHALGEPTVTYKDNGDGTHTKTTTYHCASCNKDIVKVETLSHKAGDLIPVDENYHKVACDDCNADVQNYLPHDYTEHEVLDDTHIKHICACGHYYIEELQHQHVFGAPYEVDNPNPSAGDYCYKVVRSCNDLDCDEELVVDTVGHEFNEDGYCERCFTDAISTTNEFDHEVAEDDDFDYDVAEDDDFDLQEEDIPETAFLTLSRADIEYMADMAIARLELENALNEEMQAQGLTLTYKG